MRICYFGLYDPRYPRNAMLIRGLRAAGVEVVEVRESLRFGSTPSLRPASRTRRLAEQFRALDGALDAVVVPTFNQALVPLARGLAWGRRTPVVHDFMVSLWDTAVGDRGQRPRHPDSLYRRVADVAATRLADALFTDYSSGPLGRDLAAILRDVAAKP